MERITKLSKKEVLENILIKEPFEDALKQIKKNSFNLISGPTGIGKSTLIDLYTTETKNTVRLPKLSSEAVELGIYYDKLETLLELFVASNMLHNKTDNIFNMEQQKIITGVSTLLLKPGTIIDSLNSKNYELIVENFETLNKYAQLGLQQYRQYFDKMTITTSASPDNIIIDENTQVNIAYLPQDIEQIKQIVLTRMDYYSKQIGSDVSFDSIIDIIGLDYFEQLIKRVDYNIDLVLQIIEKAYLTQKINTSFKRTNTYISFENDVYEYEELKKARRNIEKPKLYIKQ